MTAVVPGAHPRRRTVVTPTRTHFCHTSWKPSNQYFPHLLTKVCLRSVCMVERKTQTSRSTIIWECCPKKTFHGRSRVKLVVDNPTVVCNNGELRKLNIFQKLNTDSEAGVFATRSFTALDSARISRACTLGMQQAKKQRQQRTLDNAILGRDTEEFYLSGAHE